MAVGTTVRLNRQKADTRGKVLNGAFQGPVSSGIVLLLTAFTNKDIFEILLSDLKK